MAWEFCAVIVVDDVSNRQGLLPLAVPCLVDCDSQPVAGLPSILRVGGLLNWSNDRLSTDTLSCEFSVPPKELPTFCASFAMSKSKISWRITCTHCPIVLGQLGSHCHLPLAS